MTVTPRGRGRPPLASPRDVRVVVRVTPAEQAEIRARLVGWSIRRIEVRRSIGVGHRGLVGEVIARLASPH